MVFQIILLLIAALSLLLILFLLNFYRDPKRKIPVGNNIVSPADGRIINIFKTKQDEIKEKKGSFGKIKTLTKDIAKECCVISIFMSPFDVHVNRSPISGNVDSIKHTKGRFFAAYDLEKSLHNEKNEIIISNKKIGRIKVIQIAGFLARRIICNLGKNQKLNKGQRMGKIVLGSQVMLILPLKKVNLNVNLKQKVIAGKTIMAELI